MTQLESSLGRPTTTEELSQPEDPSPESEGEVQGDLAIWRYRGIALLVTDVFVVVACFLLAYYLRFHLQFLAIKYVPPQDVVVYLKGAVLLAAAWVFWIWRNGGYECGLRGVVSPIVRIRCVLIAGGKALAVLMVISYMYRGLLLSRQVYLMTGMLAFSTMVLVRLLFRELDRDLAAQSIGLRKMLVVGMDAQAEEFARRLNEVQSTVRLAGFVAANSEEKSQSFAGYPVLGTLGDIRTIYEHRPFDKLVLVQSVIADRPDEESAASLIEIVNFCEAHDIFLYMLPNVLNVAVSQREVGTFSGMPLVEIRDASLHPVYAILKRAFDIVFSFFVLLAGLPLWVFVALLVKATSKGPVIFSQTRIGSHGRPFRIYKFRTMVADAEDRLKSLVNFDDLEVPGFKLKNDPRVTAIGKILRRTSLDEFPQFFNVLKGEMSVVGPRPELPELVARYTPRQRRRLKAKPGITGYQQIVARGIPLAASVEQDLIYLKHQGFLFDAYIVLKTILVVLRGGGVTH